MKKFLQLITFLFFALNAGATTYYSTQNGDWINAIWSTVGHNEASGLVSLPCAFTGNDVVHIAHQVTSTCGVLEIGHLGGNCSIILSPTGTFTSGAMNLYGGLLLFNQVQVLSSMAT